MEDYRCWDAHVTAVQEISLLMILESPYCGFLISFLSHARSYPPLLFIYLQTYGRNPRIDAIFWKTIAQGRGIDGYSRLSSQSFNANEICWNWKLFLTRKENFNISWNSLFTNIIYNLKYLPYCIFKKIKTL